MSRPSTTIKQNKTEVKGGQSFVYPPDLTSNAKVYFDISFFRLGDDFVDTAFGQSFKSDTSLKIKLPCPEDLRHTFSMDYSKGDLLYYSMVKSGSDSVRNALENLKSKKGNITADDIQNEFKGLLGDAGELAQALGTQMFLSTNQTLGGLVARGQGQIPNPNPTIFFNGMNLRTLVFNWRFVPRSQSESEKLHAMIRAFRNKVTPKKKGNFLTYPSIIQVKLMNDLGQDMGDKYGTKYLKSHVTDINFNYTAAGTSAFFYDGYPAAIEFTFTMQEIEQYLSEPESGVESGTGPLRTEFLPSSPPDSISRNPPQEDFVDTITPEFLRGNNG